MILFYSFYQILKLRYLLSFTSFAFKNQSYIDKLQQLIQIYHEQPELELNSLKSHFGDIKLEMELEQAEVPADMVMKQFESEKIMELNLYIKKLEHENTVMSGRMKTLLEYNEKVIEQKTDSDETQLALDVQNYECVCGGQMLEQIKYKKIENFQEGYNQFIKSSIDDNVQQQKISKENDLEKKELNRQLSQMEHEYFQSLDSYKKVIENMAEDKSNLICQVEELKMQAKQIDEAFMKSELFQQLVKHNQDLVQLIVQLEYSLKESQFKLNDQLEKQQETLNNIEKNYQDKLKSYMENQNGQQQVVIKFENEEFLNQQIEQLKLILSNNIFLSSKKLELLEKNEETLKVEMNTLRSRNREIQLTYENEMEKKQQFVLEISNLKEQINGYKLLNLEEKLEQGEEILILFYDKVQLRYDKHKQLIQEIEKDYINNQGQDQIQKFREFVGYVRMRDDKVKGLESVIEMKQQDINNLKRVRIYSWINFVKQQIQSVFDELDCNSSVYTSQMDQNKELSKLLDEMQKNESRIMKDRIQEKQKYENEKLEEHTKLIQQSLDVMKQQMQMVDQERNSHRESIQQLLKTEAELKKVLYQREEDSIVKDNELKLLKDKEKHGEIVNKKFIKQAEKYKAKQKFLKLQLKQNSKTGEGEEQDELVESMKMMINCQQCKKRIKENILIKCQHMFCKVCIEDNLKNRNRACSVCRTRFGLEDVKGIKLN